MSVTGGMKKEYRKVEDKLRSASIIKEDEEIVGVVEEVFYGSTLQRLEELAEDKSQGNRVVPVESVKMYEIIAKMGPDALSCLSAPDRCVSRVGTAEVMD